ncbi:MAG: competence protein ComEA [Gaiellaceae bacterium]|nr:competence protein ComEA [Gaiellaceae bacterium]
MPDVHVSRRAIVLGALALALALTLANRLLRDAGTASSALPATHAVPSAAAAQPVLVVDVVGAVRRPGLYRLPQGSRVADAVTRAGGPTRRADVALVNLAAPLADGTQVVVPVRAAVAGEGASSPSAPAGPVHLNTATLDQLDALPGVGPATAQKILDYRQQHGAFSSVDELDAIPGIGPARLEALRKLVAP